MQVLLVEDEILIQKSLKMLMEKRGAKVTAVSSGKDAIEQIKRHDFDRIVCDLMLTDISGFDVIEESKHRYEKSDIAKDQALTLLDALVAFPVVHGISKLVDLSANVLKK